MSEQVMIQVRFKEKVNINGADMEYNDAIYFTQDEYKAKNQVEIDTLKSERVNNWVNIVKNPPTPVEPTKEDLLAMKAEIEAQLAGVNTKLLTAKSVKVII